MNEGPVESIYVDDIKCEVRLSTVSSSTIPTFPADSKQDDILGSLAMLGSTSER